MSEYRCNIPVHRAMDDPTVAATAARVGGLRWTSYCAVSSFHRPSPTEYLFVSGAAHTKHYMGKMP